MNTLTKYIVSFIFAFTFLICIGCNSNSTNEQSTVEVRKPTGKQRLQNEGWEYIATVYAYCNENRSDFYLIFSKGDQYIAIDSQYERLRTDPPRFSVREGNYRHDGQYFNARISYYSSFYYFNF